MTPPLLNKIAAAEAHLYLREEPMRQSFEFFLLAWRALNDTCAPILEEYGLGKAHHRILFFVGTYENITPSVLLNRLGITKQSLGRALKDLKRHALLEQYQNTKDRRLRPIRLTTKGKEVEERLFDCIREVMTHAYRHVDGGQVDGFRCVLKQILQAKVDF